MKRWTIQIRKCAFILMLFQIVNSSCKSKREEIKEMLINNKCVWHIKNRPMEYGYYAYQFLKDGSCYYYFRDRQGVFNKFYFDDIIVPNTWTLNGDSNLIIQANSYLISYYSKDSFTLYTRDENIFDYLIKDCNVKW